VAVIILGGSTQQKSPNIEGAWKLVTIIYCDSNKIFVIPPGNWSQMKMWSKDHWAFVGASIQDTTTYNNYGGGSYTLKGNRYDETIVYHSGKEMIGQTIKMIIEIKKDTLFQTWPVDDKGKIGANYSIEKYVKF
jgi:hypothetical protein